MDTKMKFYPVEQIEKLMVGRWEYLLGQYWDQRTFNGRHQACPICGGNDRFRWGASKQDASMKGRGAGICNQCGSHLGLWWFMQTTGMDFFTALNDIGENFLKVEPDETEAPAIPARQQIEKAPRIKISSKPTALERYIRRTQSAAGYDEYYWLTYDFIAMLRKYNM